MVISRKGLSADTLRPFLLHELRLTHAAALREGKGYTMPLCRQDKQVSIHAKASFDSGFCSFPLVVACVRHYSYLTLFLM